MEDLDITNDKTPPKRGRAASTVKAESGDKSLVRIMVPKTKEDTRDVFVQVNGKPYLIKRGVTVEVPPEVVEVLQNAQQTTYVPEKGKDGRITLTAQETLSYPFQYA